MSSQAPPSYNFSGINYNPSYFSSTKSSGLTTATANTLYLRKTVPDTATSTETFSGGVLVNSIEPTANNTSMDLATTSISGAINIGTAVGRTGDIRIGLLTGQTTPHNVSVGSSGKSFTTINGTTVTLNGAVTINGSLSNVDTSSALTLGTTNATGVSISKAGSNTGIGGTLSVASTTTASDTITANGGLTIGPNKNITLPTTITAPTAFTMIGGTSYNTFTNVSFTQTGNVAIINVQIPNNGTYLLSALLQMSYISTPSYFYTNVATSLTAPTIGLNINGPSYLMAINWGQQPQGTIPSTGKLQASSGGSIVFTATASTYYTFTMIIPAGGYDAPSGYFNFTRLA